MDNAHAQGHFCSHGSPGAKMFGNQGAIQEPSIHLKFFLSFLIMLRQVDLTQQKATYYLPVKIS